MARDGIIRERLFGINWLHTVAGDVSHIRGVPVEPPVAGTRIKYVYHTCNTLRQDDFPATERVPSHSDR